MKVDDFMPKPEQPVTEDVVPVPGTLPTGEYAKALREMGRDEFMSTFAKTEDGNYIVPDNFIRETLAMAVVRLMATVIAHPEITEADVDPILEQLHSVVKVLNQEVPLPDDKTIGDLVTSALLDLQAFLDKYQ